MRRVLFVCTANMQRSPTAEDLFQSWKGLWEARSAGIMPVPEGKPVSQELIDWADVVVVMEPMHSHYLRSQFKFDPKKLHVLNIADRYYRDEPELKRELLKKIPPILEKL